MSFDTLTDVDIETARADYAALLARGLALDISRGKPSSEQLDLADALLALPGPGDFKAADGTDCRNYGGLTGLTELRAIFADLLHVPTENLLALGNSSLNLMHEVVSQALHSPLPGAQRRWADEEEIVFLCPVPGYDCHFAICKRFGISMVPVPLTGHGPDMDVVEALVAADPRVKGMWCVPKYSNPTGEIYSDEVVRRLAAMPTAAPDFRLLWDDAYAVHHLTPDRREVLPVLDECASAGNPDRAMVFGSTSKITHAGSGVAFFGSSQANVSWLLDLMSKQTIGPDKINQLRHVRFFGDSAGVHAHMDRHRALMAPRFETVDMVLREEVGSLGAVSWTRPSGGYFVSLYVPDGCASVVTRLAGRAGVALPPAGSAFPGGADPRDRHIRIAPTHLPLGDLREAMYVIAVCVRLAIADATEITRAV
ncbi:aminotransferase class I/II-fold pyridoxal phosphate-dependent enzyme [Streptomyces sp. NPDC050535]|uniref:aminotransferase class I/II-fold pyridoxal phosphate-dependent enzyme n=1 Tax=Streptomyces sp. NPDC050535 TaxID=3365626 RepID=UPI0037A6DF64